MSELSRFPHFPLNLLIAFRDIHTKPDRYYGTDRGLLIGRKRAMQDAKTRNAVQRMLKRVGL